MSKFRKQKIAEGKLAIEKVKDGLDSIREDKRIAVRDRHYEAASEARDMELEYIDSIVSILGLKITL